MGKVKTGNYLQGLDGITFECSIKDEHISEMKFPEEKLSNPIENTIVSIKCTGEKIMVYVNPTHAIMDRNIKPFGFADISRLSEVRSQVIGFIREYIKKYIPSLNIRVILQSFKVKSVECNLTLPCKGKANQSDIIYLLDMALDRTVLFRKRKVSSSIKKTNTSCFYTKPKEYKIKIYDKTDKQRVHGNLHVASRLLRIEVVFIGRLLKRIYGDKRTLNDILSERAITRICEQYQKVLAAAIWQRVREINESADGELQRRKHARRNDAKTDNLMPFWTIFELTYTYITENNLVPVTTECIAYNTTSNQCLLNKAYVSAMRI